MRLFVAVEPPEEVLEALRRLPRPERPGMRWTRPESWHVTLRFLGEVPDPDAVVGALAGVDLGPAARAHLGPATVWLNRDVLVVPVHGLDDLAERVRAATADVGQAPDARGFNGHVTVARRRRRGSRVEAGEVIDRDFVVDQVVLFSSTLTATGAVHQPVHRFSLGVAE